MSKASACRNWEVPIRRASGTALKQKCAVPSGRLHAEAFGCNWASELPQYGLVVSSAGSSRAEQPRAFSESVTSAASSSRELLCRTDNVDQSPASVPGRMVCSNRGFCWLVFLICFKGRGMKQIKNTNQQKETREDQHRLCAELFALRYSVELYWALVACQVRHRGGAVGSSEWGCMGCV